MIDIKIILKAIFLFSGVFILQDIKAQVVISLPVDSVIIGEDFMIPISLEGLQNSGDEICGYTLAIKYDSSVIEISDFKPEGTVSSGFSIEHDSLYTDSLYTISGAGTNCINSDGILINLKASSISVNKTALIFFEFEINEGNPEVTVLNGEISIRTLVSSEIDFKSPNTFSLHQNYPNPFNPSTNIEFSLPQTSNVELRVFDLTGREVVSLVSGVKTAGNHTVSFDASQLSSGVYIYRLKAGEFVQTRKMLLIK